MKGARSSFLAPNAYPEHAVFVPNPKLSAFQTPALSATINRQNGAFWGVLRFMKRN